MRLIYPNFNKIVLDCKRIMRLHYFYGNSWATEYRVSYWKKRLRQEIREIFDSSDAANLQQEICDAINVLSMMYEHSKAGRLR